MRSLALRLPFSMLSLCTWLVAMLAVVYVGLIALVMTYAAHTVEFSHAVRDSEAQIATLEARYLDAIAAIADADYAALGYAKPVAKAFVPGKSVTALR